MHIAPSVIRYWETEFTLKYIHGKNSKSERKFAAKDIEILQQIHYLVKDKGFTIEGARKELDAQNKRKKEDQQLLVKTTRIAQKNYSV
ncbi:MAG: MerR family transcriptional regulator [Saprospiraceae bacterium]|nr:MerR family transcriptional regulator [Saprospiraceae bacterium]